MMFAENLKAAMDAARMSASELAGATGIGNSAISQYLSGKNMPRKDKLDKLSIALGVDVDFLLHGEEEIEALKNRMTVKEAAKLMDASEQFVRVGMQQGLLPIGCAVKMSSESKKFVYYISRKKFSEYTGIAFPEEGYGGKAKDLL